jgi:hypothetical protein
VGTGTSVVGSRIVDPERFVSDLTPDPNPNFKEGIPGRTDAAVERFYHTGTETRAFVPSSELALPPLSRQRVCPHPPGTKGEDNTRLRVRGGEANSDD